DNDNNNIGTDGSIAMDDFNNVASDGSTAMDDDNAVANGAHAVALQEDNDGNNIASGEGAIALDDDNIVAGGAVTHGSFNVVAESELEGEVEENHVVNLGLAAIAVNVNSIDDGAFAGASGITQVSQNNGAASLSQQNVTVLANLSLGGGIGN